MAGVPAIVGIPAVGGVPDVAKVSAVNGDPDVAFALFAAVLKSPTFFGLSIYRTLTIGLRTFLHSDYRLSDQYLRKTVVLSIIGLRMPTIGQSIIGTREKLSMPNSCLSY